MVSRLARRTAVSAQQIWYRFSATWAGAGSAAWLVDREARYGGLRANVPRRRVSALDPRSPQQIATGGMRGGDRMARTRGSHGYAQIYARYLRPFVAVNDRLTIVELGILKGSGLAIWSELFPHSRVIGLDIDLSHAKDEWPALMNKGAFSSDNVELHTFDQLAATPADVAAILGSDRIDVMIDDALHSDAAVLNSLTCFLPHLARSFVYFVEDNASVHSVIAARHPELTVRSFGEMTVISPSMIQTNA
jgi:hypothetical protein